MTADQNGRRPRTTGADHHQYKTPQVWHQASADPAITAAADLAILTGAPVVLAHLGLVVIADVVALEAVANGTPWPPATWCLQRPDGRTAALYRLHGVAQ